MGFDTCWSHDIITEKLDAKALRNSFRSVKVNNGRKILIIYSIKMEILMLASSNYCHIIIKVCSNKISSTVMDFNEFGIYRKAMEQ